MSLLALGLNHKTASIDLRERLAFSGDALQNVLKKMSDDTNISEVALLSTCNRTEIYCADHQEAQLLEWFVNYGKLTEQQVKHCFYQHYDQAAVRHIMRVASGLDSMILGESQILSQMKSAFFVAQEAGTLGKKLNRLFQHTFSVAKAVRSSTAIGSSPVSVAFAAVKMASRVFSDLSQARVLFIGAGETIELSAFHLQQQNVAEMIFANRTEANALGLAQEYQGRAIGLSDIANVIADVDLIFTATSSPLPILGKGLIERTLKVRRHRPMFMVDLAIPRDIEPEVQELDDAYLYTVDDLQHIVDDNLQMRMKAAELAEDMIHQHVDQFMTWLKSQRGVPSIVDYRTQAASMRDHELQKARQALANGQSPELVLERFANILTQKLIHHPTVALRDVSVTDDQELIQLAKTLLGLDK